MILNWVFVENTDFKDEVYKSNSAFDKTEAEIQIYPLLNDVTHKILTEYGFKLNKDNQESNSINKNDQDSLNEGEETKKDNQINENSEFYLEVSRLDHRYFCQSPDGFIMQFEIYPPEYDYQHSEVNNNSLKSQDEEIEFFVKRNRLFGANARD